MPLATVLIVDDEEFVRTTLRRELSCLDLEVLTADRAASALQVMREHAVDIVISDHAMPGTSGLRFLRMVRLEYPRAVRILLTGSADLQVAVDAINQGEIFRLVLKPWDEQDLKLAVLKACEKLGRTPARGLA